MTTFFFRFASVPPQLQGFFFFFFFFFQICPLDVQRSSLRLPLFFLFITRFLPIILHPAGLSFFLFNVHPLLPRVFFFGSLFFFFCLRLLREIAMPSSFFSDVKETLPGLPNSSHHFVRRFSFSLTSTPHRRSHRAPYMYHPCGGIGGYYNSEPSAPFPFSFWPHVAFDKLNFFPQFSELTSL